MYSSEKQKIPNLPLPFFPSISRLFFSSSILFLLSYPIVFHFSTNSSLLIPYPSSKMLNLSFMSNNPFLSGHLMYTLFALASHELDINSNIAILGFFNCCSIILSKFFPKEKGIFLLIVKHNLSNFYLY